MTTQLVRLSFFTTVSTVDFPSNSRSLLFLLCLDENSAVGNRTGRRGLQSGRRGQRAEMCSRTEVRGRRPEEGPGVDCCQSARGDRRRPAVTAEQVGRRADGGKRQTRGTDERH